MTAVSGLSTSTMDIGPTASTILPNCPNDPAGRIYSDPIGHLYAINCGTSYTGPDILSQYQPNLASCIDLCDLYNILSSGGLSTCRGVTFVENTMGINCILQGLNGTVAPDLASDSASSISFVGSGPESISISTLPSPTSSSPPTTVFSSFLTPGPVCPADNNTLWTSSNQDVFWIQCGPLATIEKRGITYNSFGECIDLCSVTDGCDYALFEFSSNACQRTTYSCQWAQPGFGGAVLIFTNATLVELPNCPNSIFANIIMTNSLSSRQMTTSTVGTATVNTVGIETLSIIGSNGTGESTIVITQPSGVVTSLIPTETLVITSMPIAFTTASTVISISTVISSLITVISNQTTTVVSTTTVTTTFTTSVAVTSLELLTTSIPYVTSVPVTLTQLLTSILTQSQPPVTVTQSGQPVTVTADSGGGGVVTVVITTGGGGNGGGGVSSTSTWTSPCITVSPSFLPPSSTFVPPG